MCDYSLHNVMSTPAKVGDELTTTSFPNSSTRGFCTAEHPEVAVCVMPGTELAFENEIECDRMVGFLPHRKLAARVARFRQIDLDKPYAHHDALELPDGQVVLLTNLCVGQKATVLQLPAKPEEEKARPQTEVQEHYPAIL